MPSKQVKIKREDTEKEIKKEIKNEIKEDESWEGWGEIEVLELGEGKEEEEKKEDQAPPSQNTRATAKGKAETKKGGRRK